MVNFAYVKERYAKDQQPSGDPDCRLGCKRRRNQRAATDNAPPTPHANPVPAATISVGEYYWDYASGVVATKVPGWGEFVLAELTLPFNQPDVAYFAPLLADTERRLGFRPQYGAFDAACDAFYVYEQLRAPCTGRVAKIVVAIGDQVEKDRILVRVVEEMANSA